MDFQCIHLGLSVYTPKTVVKHPHHHKLKHCHFWAWSIFDTTICLCCLPSISYQSKWTTLMVSTWIMSERHFVEESPDMVIKKRTTICWTCYLYIYLETMSVFMSRRHSARSWGWNMYFFFMSKDSFRFLGLPTSTKETRANRKKVTNSTCTIFQWIGSRENLQDTIDFPIQYGAFL